MARSAYLLRMAMPSGAGAPLLPPRNPLARPGEERGAAPPPAVDVSREVVPAMPILPEAPRGWPTSEIERLTEPPATATPSGPVSSAPQPAIGRSRLEARSRDEDVPGPVPPAASHAPPFLPAGPLIASIDTIPAAVWPELVPAPVQPRPGRFVDQEPAIEAVSSPIEAASPLARTGKALTPERPLATGLELLAPTVRRADSPVETRGRAEMLLPPAPPVAAMQPRRAEEPDTITIGTIEVRLQPAPVPPAPPPLFREALASPARRQEGSLARDFGSRFGLRQG